MDDNILLDRGLLKKVEDLRADRGVLEAMKWLDREKDGVLNPLGQIQKNFFLSEKPITGIIGPNKLGKTLCGVGKFCIYETGKYPDWFPEKLKLKTPVSGRIIIDNFASDIYWKDLLPELEKDIPEWMYTTRGGYRKANNNGVFTHWQLAKCPPCNGSSFSVMSNQEKTSAYEGAKLQVLLVNEPCYQEHFNASIRGMVMGQGKIMFMLTPMGLSDWIIDDIVPLDEADIQWGKDIRDNYTLDEEWIKFMEKTLSAEERDARLYGKPMHYAGLVYPMFDRDVHCIPRYDIPKNDPRFLVCDPHDRVNWAFLWGAINEKHQIIWYDYAWVRADKTFEEFSEIIKTKERMELEGARVKIRRIMDAAYCHKPVMDSGGQETDEGFQDYGIFWQPSSVTSRIVRRAALIKYLKYDIQEPITQYNQPAMYWFNDLHEPVHQMERLVFGEWGHKTGQDREKKGKYKEKNSHFPSCCEFLATEHPKYRREGLSQIKSQLTAERLVQNLYRL